MRTSVLVRWPVAVLLPLSLWGGHFLFLYGVVSVVCSRRVVSPFIPVLLWVATVIALAAIAWLGFTYRRLSARAAGAERMQLRAGMLLSLIAFIATVWTALPMLMVAPCE